MLLHIGGRELRVGDMLVDPGVVIVDIIPHRAGSWDVLWDDGESSLVFSNHVYTIERD